MEDPIEYDDSDNDELKARFDQLVEAMYSMDRGIDSDDTDMDNMDEDNNEVEVAESYEALNERIRLEVTARPTLANIVAKRSIWDDHPWSLLKFAYTTLYRELSHPIIKFLIEANPSALVWNTGCDKNTLIFMSGHPRHCVLMPWIATNHPWVLDHELCQREPPVFGLIYQYNNRSENGGCTAAMIQQFFEAYPKGLTQKDGECQFPIHAIISMSKRYVHGKKECNVDLFKWMSEQCTTSMIKTDKYKKTPLHHACERLGLHGGSPEICKYLIAKCGEAVRMARNWNNLPIHSLLMGHRQRSQSTLEVAMLLLQKYPESFHMATSNDSKDTLSSDLFIHHAYLQATQKAFQEAVSSTKDSLMRSTCDVFGLWADSWGQVLEAEKEQVESSDGESESDEESLDSL